MTLGNQSHVLHKPTESFYPSELKYVGTVCVEPMKTTGPHLTVQVSVSVFYCILRSQTWIWAARMAFSASVLFSSDSRWSRVDWRILESSSVVFTLSCHDRETEGEGEFLFVNTWTLKCVWDISTFFYHAMTEYKVFVNQRSSSTNLMVSFKPFQSPNAQQA